MTAGNPHSMELLRMDCLNVTSFFGKRGTPVMSVKQLFEFVINADITEDQQAVFIETVR